MFPLYWVRTCSSARQPKKPEAEWACRCRTDCAVHSAPRALYAIQPVPSGPECDLGTVFRELEHLFLDMPREDIQHLLDYARRLAR
jgi:hypothetical protein